MHIISSTQAAAILRVKCYALCFADKELKLGEVKRLARGHTWASLVLQPEIIPLDSAASPHEMTRMCLNLSKPDFSPGLFM